MRRPKIFYLQLAMIYILSPVEIHSERIKMVKTGGNTRQVQISEDHQSQRLKTHPVTEKAPVAEDDEESKTLAQQVLDGKYGLIQTELFSSPVKRPGILSYEINPEVPKDNINNLGGLKPDEIWLAENHLLVLKGGSFNENEQTRKIIWPPIDSYVAPQRQVKIPPNPKIPPPFPIQLKEGGPIEVIKGKNGTKTVPSYFGPPFLFQNPTTAPKEANETKQRQGNLTQGNGGIPFPFLPSGIGLFPPAIAFLPPPGNLTELDEDDPNIYYPPRYDFVYIKNYTSYVPPGPLVPGIILPPPPDFFAPLENKTRLARPILSNKELHSAKKPSKTRLPAINRPRQRLPSHANNFKPKGIQEQKGKSTSQPIFHRNHNNVILKPTYLNQTNEEWVPIPAPRPFYITDLKKIKIISEDLNDQYFKYEIPKNGWVYENTTNPEYQAEKIKTQNYHHNNMGKDDSNIRLTTDITPVNRVTSPQTSNVNFHFHGIPWSKDEKDQLNENKSRNSKLTTIKLLKSAIDENLSPRRPSNDYYYNKHYIESNTLVPQVIYEDVTVKTTSDYGRIMVPNIKYEGDYRNAMKQTSKPLSFLYYEQEPKYQADDGGYVYDVPGESVINPYQPQFDVIPHQPMKKNKINTFTTTRKPPVYEYSYSAPGYGTIEAPKVGNNFEMTPKPIIYDSTSKTEKRPQYIYYDYQSTPKQNKFNIQQSTADIFYSTVQTPINIKNKFVNIDSYQTEKPYISYNAQDIGPLDENTKKYFDLFGQKINQEDKEITTPLPHTNEDVYSKPYYQNYDNPTPLPTKAFNKNIRFPEIYNIQSDRPYYMKEEYTTTKHINSDKKTKSNSATDNYSYFYGPRNIGFQTYRGNERELVRPNHPLDSDVDVNYKITNPTINPDAEFFDPAYINPLSYKENSYISYRLPGNSGHFYFLTPQTIQQGNYQARNEDRYQQEQKSHFVRRHNY